MRNAVIENGVVVNIIEGSAPGLSLIPDDGTARIGGTWDGQDFVPPASPSAVPAEVTYRQGMAVLIKHGLDAQISEALNAQLTAATQSGDSDAILKAKLALNDWNNSTAFLRSWPLIAKMQQAFGWSDSLVDALFVEAQTL